MTLDLSRYPQHETVTDPDTNLTFVAGVTSLNFRSGAIGEEQQTVASPAIDLFVIIPPEEREAFAARTGRRVPEDGVFHLGTEMPETFGFGMTQAFGYLQEDGFTAAENTKVRIRDFATNAFRTQIT